MRDEASRTPGAVATSAVPVLVVLLVVAATVVRPQGVLVTERVGAWLTVWVAICVQALPFLVLGVVVSGSIAAFVPADLLQRIVPRDPSGAVFAAGLSGVVLPGCECASVPVVLVATAVAFSGQPMMVIARFLAGLVTAWVVGWLWVRFGQDRWIKPAGRTAVARGPAWEVFRRTAVHDLLHAGGFLVLGGGIAGAVNVLLPQRSLESLSGHAVSAVLIMAALAVLVSICSEADAFVAASLTAFSPTAQLVFMTVSPMVDLKLISMQAGTFGPGFALRFAPATFAVAVFVAVGVAAVAL